MPAEFDPTAQIAAELNLPPRGVRAVIALLSDGNTVPFVARYRKEATGNLDEVQIRAIGEKQEYLQALHARRQTILETIDGQGKLTDALRRRIERCTSKAELEDLYLPFKPKRRTRALIARERGLGPLGELILAQGHRGSPEQEAARFVSAEREVPDVEAALKGARDIAAEAVSERAEVRALVRETYAERGLLRAEATPEAREKRTRFEQYYEYSEPVARVPSHRYLAVRRGEREALLRVKIEVDTEQLLPRMERLMGLDRRSPWAPHLAKAVADAHKRLVGPSVSTDVRVQMKLAADRAAVEIFARNLRQLLLSSPLGGRPVVGIDPGLRTGCKTVALGATGRLIEHTVIYPGQGSRREAEARATLVRLVKDHQPAALAIGNGTGGRETERFARQVMKDAGLTVTIVSVNESGASIYSASDVAREEFPDLDLTVRGAVSIGRRLQDPLAELVKIDPKSIGVGQYQHDVHQPMLQRQLDAVVESCVNHVGVDLNTASAPLLARVAGIGPSLARKVVAHRDATGPFDSRKALLKVSGLGPRTFEQCAGFLRITDGTNPLDRSAVHPERYALVERMASDLGVDLSSLVGDSSLARRIDLQRYVADGVGLPTLEDIIAELEKPGRDPRTEFVAPKFREDVETLEDLEEGMMLEGVVTNVTAFGAFVDIGVHQDGLVHISQLADRFVRDPSEVVAPGDRLRVRVLSVDLERRRISLSAKSGAPDGERGGARGATARDATARDAGPPRDERGGRARRGPDQRSGGRGGRGRQAGAGGRPSAGQRNSRGQGDSPGGGGRESRPGKRRADGPGQRSDGRRGGGRRDGGRRDGGRRDGGRRDGGRQSRGGQQTDGFKHNPFADLLRDR